LEFIDNYRTCRREARHFTQTTAKKCGGGKKKKKGGKRKQFIGT